MILTTLDEAADAYATTHPRLAAGLAFLRRADLHALPKGKNPVPGFDLEDLAVIVDAYDTRRPEAQIWESHRAYGDIQVVVEGAERVGWIALHSAPAVTTPYAPDAALYAVPEQEGRTPCYFTLEPGLAAVFFPHDVHAPCLMIGAPKPVRKIVVKFRL